jgi:2-haloacid dehalogenase
MLASAVESAGIGGLLDAVLSVDSIATYKTDPRVYRLALDTLGVAAADVSFLSSNRWDVAGAVAFGLPTIWVNRSGNPDEYGDLQPRATIRNLTELLTLG